ncbi:MAG TPA: HipA domain-containing protein [Parvibaculum sp.]
MTSEIYEEAFVWVWLPGQVAPVVAGRLAREGQHLAFNYGRSYLQRQEAIPIYLPELPLKAGVLDLLPGLSMPGCIRDASPDAWGRRVLINRKLGLKGDVVQDVELDELSYLLESGSDRVGALDFQTSPTDYVPRHSGNAPLIELLQSAEMVERGVPLTPELNMALHHGTSLGGARPKALLEGGEKKYVAKFSSSTDVYNVVKTEFIAMRLAAEVGLNAAPVSLTKAMGKDVLLIERFDRIPSVKGWHRRSMVSALTMFELDEMMAPYASYETLAEIIRHRFTAPKATLRELFGRMVFNILCGNTDDHARNHAAFWDGAMLELTPAYDICPQSRTGNIASQAMLIIGNDRSSKLATCLQAAPKFLLKQDEAEGLIRTQIGSIRAKWDAVCDEAGMTEIERLQAWGRQFLNPFVFEDAPPTLAI